VSICFFFSSRRRHTRFSRDWSSDVCSSDLTNRPSAPFRFYSGGGGEKGVADFIRQKVGRQFKVLPATGDKLARATAASVSWNLGRVLLPDPKSIKAPWLEDFLAVVLGFTENGRASCREGALV